MKKSSKKLIALISTVVLSVGMFAGCGSSATEETDSSNDGTTKEETGKTEEIALTFPCIWVGSDSKAEVFGKMVTDFNTEYEGKYQVNIEEQTDYDAYEDKIRTLISTGTAPDIFTVKSFADIQLFAEAGNLMDLSTFFEDSAIGDRFITGVLDDTAIDGKMYAMPYENAIIPIMYNNKLMEAAGVTELPGSFDELWDACDKLKGTGVFPLSEMTGDNAWTSMLWYSYAVAACGGADVYDKGLEDPAFVEAAEILRKMFDYTSSDAIGADATVVNGHFFNERSAVYTNGTWILGRIKSEGVAGLYDSLALSGGLSNDGENGGAYLNAVQAYICAGKQEDPAKEEAVQAFMKFITEKDKIVELTNSSGSLFAVSVDSTEITNTLQAEIVKQSADAAFTIRNFNAAMPTAVGNAFPSALEELVLDEITPQEFVETLQKAAE
ncbi:ABC transporter substrate-binding protein [Anaerobium acetethylicum]|uniref:Raffinose/stachyose/melibiose transport system substrate-binding protein n=1 Tax=Anaerobium acetethylicum TaxID=1619234 RepID=A0A1D3TV51_9FIRM|nr:extracellular solute-binding protein [Anaerobium acetethylicum]SCP97963.1 raffinose/stachyose/melibiose transport system substrate-binding protein [Anaerobium acetethylicum]